MFRVGLVLDALWHDEHLPRRDLDRTVPKIDPQIAFHHNERFISVFVVVPNEVTE